MIFFDKHRRARKKLSAYVDGELAAKDAGRLESHVESCERCQLELDELRATIGALRSMPDEEPRRSFALTPEMVRAPRLLPQPGPTPALAHGLRLSAAGLAAALALVFVIDVSNNGSSDNDGASTAAIPTAERSFAADDAGGEKIAQPLSDADEIRATDIPEAANGLQYSGATTSTPAALNPSELDGNGSGGVGGAPDSGDGEDSVSGDTDSGDAAVEPPNDAQDTTGGLPATGGDADAADGPQEPNSAPEDNLTKDAGNEPRAEAQADGSADDAAAGEAASLGADNDNGFNTLLAIEIGLAAALAIVVIAAVGLTIAGRRRGLDL